MCPLWVRLPFGRIQFPLVFRTNPLPSIKQIIVAHICEALGVPQIFLCCHIFSCHCSSFSFVRRTPGILISRLFITSCFVDLRLKHWGFRKARRLVEHRTEMIPLFDRYLHHWNKKRHLYETNALRHSNISVSGYSTWQLAQSFANSILLPVLYAGMLSDGCLLWLGLGVQALPISKIIRYGFSCIPHCF